MLIEYTYSQDTLSSTADHTLQEIRVVSDKLGSKLVDISTKIEIISEKEIESINGERLPDILKSTSSVFLKSYGLTPALNTISLNGLGAEHTLIVVDGIRLNSFQNSNIDLSLIPKENIERIEIINNGISSIYGSDALGGVVNIITKNREELSGDRTTKYNASISRGLYSTLGYSLGFYKELSDFNFRLSYSKESSDGDYEYYFDDGREKKRKNRENAEYDIYDISLITQYIIDENNFIKFISTYSDQDKEVPGIETGTSPPPTIQLDENWNNILRIDNRLAENVYLKSNFNFQNNFMRYSVGKFLNSYYKNLVYQGGSEIRIKKKKYAITSGYSFTHAQLESNEILDGTQRNQHAIFASASFNPYNWVKIYPSIRYDKISDISESPFTYKIGTNIRPFGIAAPSIRGNIGKNFRAPSFNDLYWKNSGNKDLSPEKSTNIEGGIFYGFDEIVNGQVELTYSYIKAENKIVWTPRSNGLWVPENVAESVSNNYSISLKIRRKFSDELSLKINSGIQFINTKKTSSSNDNDPTFNKYVPFIPLHSAKINFGGSYKSLEMNLLFSFTGKRYSDFANKNRMEEFNIVDANINYGFDLFELDATLRFEVNNIFNSEYEVISGYPMPLRYYKIKLILNY